MRFSLLSAASAIVGSVLIASVGTGANAAPYGYEAGDTRCRNGIRQVYKCKYDKCRWRNTYAKCRKPKYGY